MALEVVGSNPTIHPTFEKSTLNRVDISLSSMITSSDSNGQKIKQSCELFDCPGVIVQTFEKSYGNA